MSDEPETELPLARRPSKSESAFRTISEVSEELTVPQHVLRFWESKFSQLKPLKRGGGRRYYRPEDVALLLRIRDLLYKDGYTIRGAQKFLREQGRAGRAPEAGPEAEPVSDTGEPPAPVLPAMAPPTPTLPFDEPAPVAEDIANGEPAAEDPRPRFCVIPDPEEVAAESHPGIARLELEDLLAELLECKALLAGARGAAKG